MLENSFDHAPSCAYFSFDVRSKLSLEDEMSRTIAFMQLKLRISQCLLLKHY